MGERPVDTALEESTNRYLRVGLGLMIVLVLAFPAYRWFEPNARADAHEALTADLASYGAELFASQCVACHGENALGGDIGPGLNSKQFLDNVDDDQIISLISVGIPGSQMQAYSLDFGGPLTLEQITALATYLRSLQADAPDNPDWRAVVGG